MARQPGRTSWSLHWGGGEAVVHSSVQQMPAFLSSGLQVAAAVVSVAALNLHLLAGAALALGLQGGADILVAAAVALVLAVRDNVAARLARVGRRLHAPALVRQHGSGSRHTAHGARGAGARPRPRPGEGETGCWLADLRRESVIGR